MVLLALVQAVVLSLLHGIRGSGNVDDLTESLGTVLSTEKCENGRGFPRSRNSDGEPHSQWKNMQWLATSGLSFFLSFFLPGHSQLSALVFRQLCV